MEDPQESTEHPYMSTIRENPLRGIPYDPSTPHTYYPPMN